MFITYKV